MRVSSIVAMARSRVIGLKEAMPWHIPGDLKYFKKITMGKPIIMGRKTLQSIGKRLPGRTNIVLSKNISFAAKGITTVRDNKEALSLARKVVGDDGEVIIVGGAKIYNLFMEETQRVYLTQIHASFDGDTYFPKLNMDNWTEKYREDHSGYPSYSFITLDRSPN